MYSARFSNYPFVDSELSFTDIYDFKKKEIKRKTNISSLFLPDKNNSYIVMDENVNFTANLVIYGRKYKERVSSFFAAR